MFPDTTFKIFEQKPREERTTAPKVAATEDIEYGPGSIDPQDLPF
jgi:hypothetical protein